MSKVSGAKTIVPVILSGGIGSRLWPLSRENYPKQFLNLHSKSMTLFQETVARINDVAFFEKPIIISNIEHRFIIAEQLQSCNFSASAIILEPCPRNTAPALAVAALYIAENFGENAVMLVLPSDHIIEDNDAFIDTVKRTITAIPRNKLVAFGIKPDRPETGYGYIKYDAEYSEALNEKEELYEVDDFVEKPSFETAKRYLESGGYAWNSGIFLFPVKEYLSELEEFYPEIVSSAEVALSKAIIDMDFIRLNEKAFAISPSISVDYTIMENTKKAFVASLDCGWSDAGSWDAVWNVSDKDDNGNVVIGENYVAESHDCYISCQEGPKISALGVKNLAIISTYDSVLVMDKSRAQDVKYLVEDMRKRDEKLVSSHRRVYRPWGYYDKIHEGKRYQVKRIHIRPGGKISHQLHHHRAEHWVIVSGTALVTLEGKEMILTENMSIYIPYGKKHRLENQGKVELDIIEIQSGSYLGEDDIIRFDDEYGRSETL